MRALEEQYDAFSRGARDGNLLAERARPLPTAEELGAELERSSRAKNDRRGRGEG